MSEVNASPAESDAPADWGQQAATAFLDLVDNVRGKTTGPLLKVARLIAYSMLLIVAATMLVILLIIGLVRAIDIAVPGNVWGAHFILGGIFLILGMFCWSKRRG